MNQRKKKRVLLSRMPRYPWIDPNSWFAFVPADDSQVWFEQLKAKLDKDMQDATGLRTHHMEVGVVERFRFIVSAS